MQISHMTRCEQVVEDHRKDYFSCGGSVPTFVNLMTKRNKTPQILSPCDFLCVTQSQ